MPSLAVATKSLISLFLTAGPPSQRGERGREKGIARRRHDGDLEKGGGPKGGRPEAEGGHARGGVGMNSCRAAAAAAEYTASYGGKLEREKKRRRVIFLH